MNTATEKAIWRHARRHGPRPRRRGPELETVLVRLCRGQVVLGRAYRVGPYAPAVRDPDGHAWAVLDGADGAVVLAHDAFEAARWFLLCEAGLIDAAGSVLPIRVASDTEAAALRRETDEHLARWLVRCEQWLARHRRQRRSRAA